MVQKINYPRKRLALTPDLIEILRPLHKVVKTDFSGGFTCPNARPRIRLHAARIRE